MHLKRRSHLYSDQKAAKNINIKANGYDVDHANGLEGRDQISINDEHLGQRWQE